MKDWKPRTDMVEFANSILSGWGDAMSNAMRPAEGAERYIQEVKMVKVRCEYPDPDDGVSYTWKKVDD